MTKNKKIPEPIKQLLRSQKVGVLASLGNGHPYGNLIAFATDKEFRRIEFVTPVYTRKYANLKAEPRVAFVVDSRKNQAADFHDAAALTVLGRAREIEASLTHPAVCHYLSIHPYLKDFVLSPSCRFFSIDVERYVMVTGLHNVIEVDLQP